MKEGRNRHRERRELGGRKRRGSRNVREKTWRKGKRIKRRERGNRRG